MITALRICLPALALLLALPLPARAIPAITCHCFTDRSFDPARPAAADPYFLATTQNSFFASVFKTDKKAIVMKKQQGTSSDDLWVAYRVASRSGASADKLLQTRQKNDSWHAVITPLRIAAHAQDRRFTAALQARASTAHLAEAVVDDLIVQYRLLGEAELAAVRLAGASNQELIIATVIAARTRQSARQIYLEVKSGSGTWGSLLQRAKIDSRDMSREIAGILPLPPR